jgi:hypothetical protein
MAPIRHGTNLAVKNEGCFKLGYKIWGKEWDKEGNLIREYKIEDHPDEQSWLETTREWNKSHNIS